MVLMNVLYAVVNVKPVTPTRIHNVYLVGDHFIYRQMNV